MNPIEADLAKLRAQQTKRVMKRVPRLLDHWDDMANDERSAVRKASPVLVSEIEKLRRAVDGGGIGED